MKTTAKTSIAKTGHDSYQVHGENGDVIGVASSHRKAQGIAREYTNRLRYEARGLSQENARLAAMNARLAAMNDELNRK